MATLNPSQSADEEQTKSALKVTRYEQASSILITSLILVGTAAVVLFGIWFVSVLVFSNTPKPIRMIQYPGRGDHAPGFARDAEAPGQEEVDQIIQEPTLEAALEPVSDLASTVASSIDAISTDAVVSSQGEGGLGDSRPPGPLGEGEGVIPPWERWDIEYAAADVNTYARQLDFFKIELGAAGGTKFVDYAFNLSSNPPSTRQGSSKEETRVYFTWKRGKLREFDQGLLARAGIKTQGRIVMQFIPQALNEQLHTLEFNNSPRDPKEWYRTTFGVRPSGSGYEFYIIEQLFRPAPAT